MLFEDEPKFKTKTEWTNEARENEFNMSSNQIQNKQKLLTKNQNKAKRHRPNPDPPAHGQSRRGRRPGPPWAMAWAAVEEGPSLQCFVSPFQLPIRSKDIDEKPNRGKTSSPEARPPCPRPGPPWAAAWAAVGDGLGRRG